MLDSFVAVGEKFLEVLIRVSEQAGGDRPTPPQRQALEVSPKCFRTGAPRHAEDEERSLFPRMRACADPQAREAVARLEALEADHKTAEAAHARVDELGRRWLADGELPEADLGRLRRILRELREAYRRHIAVEEQEVFPLAGKKLGKVELREVGRDMSRRRGLGDADESVAVQNREDAKTRSRCCRRMTIRHVRDGFEIDSAFCAEVQERRCAEAHSTRGACRFAAAEATPARWGSWTAAAEAVPTSEKSGEFVLGG